MAGCACPLGHLTPKGPPRALSCQPREEGKRLHWRWIPPVTPHFSLFGKQVWVLSRGRLTQRYPPQPHSM